MSSGIPDAEGSSTVVKLPTYKGVPAGYQKFRLRFSAYCNAKGFAIGLKPQAVNMPTSETDVTDTDPLVAASKLAYVKANANAVSAYTLALEGDQVFQMVMSATTADWPNGLAHLITDKLEAQYQPHDLVAEIELDAKMQSIIMETNASPLLLFNQIAALQLGYSAPGRVIPDSKFYPMIIRVAPHQYDDVIQTALEAGTVSLDSIQTAMMKKYRFIIAKNPKLGAASPASKSPIETALMANTDIVCYKCRAKGHKANDPNCPMKSKPYAGGAGRNGNQGGNGNGNGNGKFRGKCNHCGMRGHKASDCFEKSENAGRRPSNWKSKMTSEATGAALNNDRTPSELNAVAMNEDFSLCQSCDSDVKWSEAGLMATMLSKPTLALLKDPNIFVGDTGATCDSTASDYGMYDCIKTDTNAHDIIMGDNKTVATEKIGALSSVVCDKNGNEVSHLKLSEMSYVPDAAYNLFSIAKRVDEGWDLKSMKGADGETMLVLEKDGGQIKFDIKIKTPKGAVYCMYLKRKEAPTEAGIASLDTTKKIAPPSKPKITMNINHAHQLFGHCDEGTTRQAAYAQGYGIVRGTLKPCEYCATAKAKQKSVPKLTVPDTAVTKPNERVSLDISTIKAPKAENVSITQPNWRVIVDEYTEMKFSDFYSTKDGMVEPTCEKLEMWKEAGIPVKYLRMDNAGENLVLGARLNSADWKLNVKPEYTARDTPQQNSLAESAFRTIYSFGRAMMYAANVPGKQQYTLAKYALLTATMLGWLQVKEIGGIVKTRYQHWHPDGKMPLFAKNLRIWGEAGVVKTKLLGTPKVSPRGTLCMLVGYALNHAHGVYRMWDPITNRVKTSRDVVWMRRMFYPPKGTEEPIAQVPIPLDFKVGESDTADAESVTSVIENEEPVDQDESLDVPAADQVPVATVTTRTGRVSVAPQRLVESEWANVAIKSLSLSHAEQNYYAMMAMASGNEYAPGEVAFIGIDIAEVATVGMGVAKGIKNTAELKVIKFKEAMSGPDRKQWAIAVKEEYHRMISSNVFLPVKKKDVPVGATITSSTWACKKKANGTYRARLNCRGFLQIEGEHFDSSNIAAPVTNEMSVRTILTLACMAGWSTYMLDVKGAFLLGEFEDGEQIYMSVPEGFEEYYPTDEVLFLLKTIYGTRQAAMAFWREMNRAMKDMLQKRSVVDPCLFFRWTEHGLVVWLVWVDDCLCIGPEKAVRMSAEEMKKRFDCDDIGEVTEYVGCKVDHDKLNGSIKFTQPVMIQSFSDEYKIEEAMKRPPKTPAEPGSVLPPAVPEDYVSQGDLTYYRSGVGRLLHMMRWSRPEIYSSVRELSRSLKGASPLHIKAMHRVMAFVVNSPLRGFVLKPKRRWNGKADGLQFIISGEADSDYAKDPVTRRSVSGNVTNLDGVVIIAKSIMQKTVALSVTESELMSGVSCAQDMLYEMRLLESIGLQVEKPMILRIDNKGAVDLANNWSCGGRTRHVKLNFLRELKEGGIIKTVWFPGWDNPADMFTKNLAGPDFSKHRETLFGNDEY